MLRRSIIAAAAILSISAGQAFAGPYSAIYSFGDSLSDVGNVFIATGGAKPASPYVNGQFSNGPVWVQDLATELGLSPLKLSLHGGTDYAWGGATTGFPLTNNPNVPNLTQQIAAFGASAPANALYTFSIGANDLFGILNAGLSVSASETLAADAAAVVAQEAIVLQSEGARDLVLFDVPDLGVTPGILSQGAAASAAASYPRPRRPRPYGRTPGSTHRRRQ